MIFKYSIGIKLSSVEEVEFVESEDIHVDVTYKQQVLNKTLADIRMYGRYKIDIGQCGGDVLNDYFEGWEEINFYSIEFDGIFTKIEAEEVITTYTIDENTGSLNVISDIKFIMN